MNKVPIFLLVGLLGFMVYVKKGAEPATFSKTDQSAAKRNAFTILQNKCNTCHANKKRLVLFSLSNMDSLKFQINHQVFVTKKMPKGSKNQLSEAEEQDLRNWLEALN